MSSPIEETKERDKDNFLSSDDIDRTDGPQEEVLSAKIFVS